MGHAVHFHSQIAPRWESNYKSEVFSVRKQVVRELLADRELPGQRWLDAECGTGTLARFLAQQKGCDVVGVDASEAMIELCAQIPHAEFAQIDDICKTGFADESFDGVLCSRALEFVAEPQSALRELHRVLRKNGSLLISVRNAHPLARWPVVFMYWLAKHFGRKRWFEYLDHSKHCYSESRFSHLLKSYGFGVQAVRTFGGLRGPSPVVGPGTLMMFRAVKT